MLTLSVTCILPADVRIIKKMKHVMLKPKSRESRLQRRLKTSQLTHPTLLIRRCLKRQCNHPLQFLRHEPGCKFVCRRFGGCHGKDEPSYAPLNSPPPPSSCH